MTPSAPATKAALAKRQHIGAVAAGIARIDNDGQMADSADYRHRRQVRECAGRRLVVRIPRSHKMTAGLLSMFPRPGHSSKIAARPP